jgi:hypothetical protein
MAERAFAVRTALSVHLEQAQVHAQLDFIHSFLAGESPHHHLPGLVIPLIEQVRNIEIHALNIMLGEFKSTQRMENMHEDNPQDYGILRPLDAQRNG